jgi:hypothetical protein
MTEVSLSPRARAILVAVEREIAERQAAAAPREPEPVRPLRIDTTLLTALELAVAGATRADVRSALNISDDALDAVFGDGSPPEARLTRAQ